MGASKGYLRVSLGFQDRFIVAQRICRGFEVVLQRFQEDFRIVLERFQKTMSEIPVFKWS